MRICFTAVHIPARPSAWVSSQTSRSCPFTWRAFVVDIAGSRLQVTPNPTLSSVAAATAAFLLPPTTPATDLAVVIELMMPLPDFSKECQEKCQTGTTRLTVRLITSSVNATISMMVLLHCSSAKKRNAASRCAGRQGSRSSARACLLPSQVLALGLPKNCAWFLGICRDCEGVMWRPRKVSHTYCFAKTSLSS